MSNEKSPYLEVGLKSLDVAKQPKKRKLALVRMDFARINLIGKKKIRMRGCPWPGCYNTIPVGSRHRHVHSRHHINDRRIA